MPSDRQMNANRNNARRSTGPKSDPGKAASSRNALKHGLAAKHHLLPIENTEEFHELLDACREEFQPQTDCQDSLVRPIANHRLEDLAEYNELTPLDEYRPLTHEEEDDL